LNDPKVPSHWFKIDGRLYVAWLSWRSSSSLGLEPCTDELWEALREQGLWPHHSKPMGYPTHGAPPKKIKAALAAPEFRQKLRQSAFRAE